MPAAAVIREGLALSGMIGRKGFVGGIMVAINKRLGQNPRNVFRTLLLEGDRG